MFRQHKWPLLSPCKTRASSEARSNHKEPNSLFISRLIWSHITSPFYKRPALLPPPIPPQSPTYIPTMHPTTLLPLLALAFTTLAAPLETRTWGPAEYHSLGCPTNTTKPYASQYEQTEVLNTFANEVFVHQEVALGYDTYAAVNFINHAPEVSGVSSSSFSSLRPS